MTQLRAVFLLGTIVCVFPFAHAYKFVDLSHPLSPSTLYWPGVPTFNRTRVMGGTNENNVWIEVGVFSSGEHGGTHIDVPRHFIRDGYDLKDFPLERTVAEGVMVDCSDEAAANYDYAVTVEKLTQWEEEHGRIPDEAAVLLNFGYASKFSDHNAYLNTQDPSDASTFHFPFISADAAQWLVDNRKLKMIGMDVPSPDAPISSTYPTHLIFLPKNILIMENVNIPDSLPPRDFRVHSSPLKIEDGTGAQTRIYAMLYEKMDGGSARLCMQSSVLFVASLVVASAVVDILTGGRIRG
ncbi:kynurenine formamidase [Plakobranchus ocellatus]|uniref:Kynurenine formamidase n=1 Tax=Plakobranchus ocellatus TaxID=259542 RepID=A0AAV4A3K6_9GAST|nr:kynurenine formamidase [Plakobranchus ocellatus]